MSKTLNRVISICLVVALMCGIFLTPIAQPKADAIAITATTGMIAAGVTLLTMLGVTFASTGAAEKASKAIVEGSKDIHDWVKRIIPGPSGDPDKNTLMMDAAATGGLALFVNKAKELFGNKKKSGTVEILDNSCCMYQNIKCYTNLSSLPSDLTDCNKFIYSHCDYHPRGKANAIVIKNAKGKKRSYYFEVTGDNPKRQKYRLVSDYNTDTTWYCYCCKDGSIYEFNPGDEHYFHHYADVPRIGFYRYIDNEGSVYINVFMAVVWVDIFGKTNYEAYCQVDGNFVSITHPNNYLQIYDASPVPVTTQVPYQNVSPYEMSIIYNALAEKLEKGNITIDYTDTLDQIENHSDEQLNISQEQLLKEAEIQKTLEEIKAGQGDGTTQLEEQDMDIPEAPDLTWKFPFCIPFDLIALVGALNAKPKDPKWEIPFHVESIGFDDSIGLDLTKFEPVSEVLRVIITIMFLLGLIVVTRKMIKG